MAALGYGHIEVNDLPVLDGETPRVDSGYPRFDDLSRHIMMWLSQAKARRNTSPPPRPWRDYICTEVNPGPATWRREGDCLVTHTESERTLEPCLSLTPAG